MAGNSEHKDQLKDRLNERYRIIFLNDNTLNEIRSFKLKRWHIIASFLGFMALIFISTLLLIYLTPLNKYASKWIGIENNAIFVDLNKKIYELEQMAIDQEVYKKGIEALINAAEPPDGPRKPVKDATGTDTKSLRMDQPAIGDFFITPPIKGIVSDTFDASRAHYGIDIIAPKDSPIKSILPGIVIQSDWNPETGNSITVQHPYGLVSVYKHNSSLLKKLGERVEAGESIAIIGNTGELSSGPHLHFEMWYNGQALNPGKLINF